LLLAFACSNHGIILIFAYNRSSLVSIHHSEPAQLLQVYNALLSPLLIPGNIETSGNAFGFNAQFFAGIFKRFNLFHFVI
jgi:hypothetical protein